MYLLGSIKCLSIYWCHIWSNDFILKFGRVHVLHKSHKTSALLLLGIFVESFNLSTVFEEIQNSSTPLYIFLLSNAVRAVGGASEVSILVALLK